MTAARAAAHDPAAAAMTATPAPHLAAAAGSARPPAMTGVADVTVTIAAAVAAAVLLPATGASSNAQPSQVSSVPPSRNARDRKRQRRVAVFVEQQSRPDKSVYEMHV